MTENTAPILNFPLPDPIDTLPSSAEIRAAQSVVLDRLLFLKRAGVSFNGERDLYEVLGYDRRLSAARYRDRYARGGIAARVVEAFPKATWRGGVELIEDQDPKVTTAFEQAWIDLNERLKIETYLQRVDILAGLSTFAVLLIGAPGQLEEELPRGKADDLMYLQPYGGGGGPAYGNSRRHQDDSDADVKVFEYCLDPQNERFGLPNIYQIQRLTLADTSFQNKVHWSRVIHIAEGLLDDEVFGLPSLERVWNLLDDLDKVTGGGAEAFWIRANQGLQLDLDKDVQLGPEELDKLKAQANEYQHQIRRMLTTRGVTANTLGSDVANFANPADAVLAQIAGAKGIPKRILTGSEMGELASSQDRDNWKDQVNGRQTGHAGPNLVRQLVDRFIKYGYLPTPKKYEVKFAHIQTMTEEEKAEGSLQWAQAQGADGPVFSRDENRDHWYGMEPWPKPDVDKATGEHTSPEHGLPLDPKVDPETGLPIKVALPAVSAVDPETGLPMLGKDGQPIPVDHATRLPLIPAEPTKKPVKKFPRAASLYTLESAGLDLNLESVLEILEQAVEQHDVVEIDRIVGFSVRAAADFDESKVSRVPSGSSEGGEFAKSGDGGGDSGAEKPWKSDGGFEHSGIKWNQPTDPKTGRPIPIKVTDLLEAVALIHEGKVVEVKDVQTAHTLINKLAEIAAEAKAAGKEAKDYDLCQIAAAGSNIFCAESLRAVDVGGVHYPDGIPRLEMPQLGGEPEPGSQADQLPKDKDGKVDGSDKFIAYLEGIGMRTTAESVPAASLRASQRELIGSKVAGMMNAKNYDPGKKPVFVSTENGKAGYVIDGHHRFAALVGRDAEDGKLGDIQMNVIRVNAPISEILHLSNVWSKKFGIKQVGGPS